MYTPLVSVIIPNYYHSKFLEERLESILQQTYKNFEIIILDDCSPDNGASRAIIEKYRNNPHVSHIIYNERNSGNTFKQWEKGIALAQGELIWIAESDDSCLPTMLATLVSEYQKYKDCVIAYTSFLISNQEGVIKYSEIKHPIFHFFLNQLTTTRHFAGKEYIKRYLTVGNLIENASTAIFSREAATSIPKDYINYSGAGDYLFWYEIAKRGSVSLVDKHLSIFRRHDSVVTFRKDMDGSNFRANKEIIDLIFNQFDFSALRYRYCRAHQIYRIKNTRFDSEKTRSELLEMWGNNGIISIKDKIVFNVAFFLRRLRYLI